MWLQYYLDNFKSVKEIIDKSPEFAACRTTARSRASNRLPEFQLVPRTIEGSKATLHLSLEDKNGDTAVIEYLRVNRGKPEVHCALADDKADYAVVTNSLTCGVLEFLLKKYEGFGGQWPLPGTTHTDDRFVRASYYRKNLPSPRTRRELIAYLFAIMRNVSKPFTKGESATWWRTVTDLTSGVYFVESTLRPNIIWVDLKAIKPKFEEGTGVKRLDLGKISETTADPVGDVTSQFKWDKHIPWPASV